MLKSELFYHQRFATREQPRRPYREHIEMLYNRQRAQASLDYLSTPCVAFPALCVSALTKVMPTIKLYPERLCETGAGVTDQAGRRAIRTCHINPRGAQHTCWKARA